MHPPERKSPKGSLAALLLTFAMAAPFLPQAALAQQPGAAPPAVTVAQPLRRQITEWDEHLARLEPSARVELRARVSGQVAAVHFRDGQVVRQGDLLFTLDRRPFEIAVDSARAELARAQAQAVLAQQEVDRTLPLISNRIAPMAQLDARRAALAEAVAQRDAAQAALRKAQLDLEWSEIRAPIGGRISDRRVDAGNLVQAGETLLTTILQIDPIYAVFDAPEADYLRLARLARSGARPSDQPARAGQGNPVEIRLADEEGWDRQGRMDFTDVALDPRSGTVRARAVLANPDLFLTPGVFARLRLRTGASDSLLLPDAAVAADQAERMVLTVAQDGMVVPKPVSLGPLVDGLRVIRSGLAPQDRVVVAGLHLARPGSRVTAEAGRIGPASAQLTQAR